MAEFKLGRIKFVWKNDWQQNTTYYKDDVVRFGARVYMCVEGHTSSTNFNNDFNIVPPKWNVASDGQSWKGDWTTSTEYRSNDIVKYGANLYIAKTLHTSTNDAALGLENDIANWDLFGTGSDWKNAWTISTRYKVNDLVKYGANLYLCKTAHTSTSDIALGLENDIANWDLYNQALEFKGEWQTATRYKINDIIKYGANLFRVNAPHTSNTFTGDASYLDSFVEGIKFENLWDDGKLYQPGDIVAYGGNQYIAVAQNINVLPSSSETDWSIFSKGFAFRGAWGEDSSLQDYRPGDVVNVGAYIYVATNDSQNKEPGRAADWADYWDRLSEGFNWRGDWVDDQYYVSGDVVRFNNSSYVCIKSHISEEMIFQQKQQQHQVEEHKILDQIKT